jgi:hypothetical protein
MSWAAVGLIPAAAPSGADELVLPAHLGNGVQLDRVPHYLTGLTGPGLAWGHLQWLAPATEYVLVYPYARITDPGELQIGERFQLANLAVWLVNPHTDLHYRYVVHIDVRRGANGLSRLSTFDQLYSGRPTEPTTAHHVADAHLLNETIAGLVRQGPLWIAIRTLWGALNVGWFHNRYAQLWTALEALFGPREGDAVSFRVSQNLAFFLANTIEERVPLFDAAKRAYGKRSKVVHGEGQAIRDAEHTPLIHEAENWLRVALVRILRSPEYLDAFQTAKRRDAFFERRVFADGTEAPGLAADGA